MMPNVVTAVVVAGIVVLAIRSVIRQKKRGGCCGCCGCDCCGGCHAHDRDAV